ncbi:MAG: N-6 DNA methylase, partial [Gemmatimonadaceae bacterium]|nr:N-6 DNA methylase [Gemmatimonadaceae bacterium]
AFRDALHSRAVDTDAIDAALRGGRLNADTATRLAAALRGLRVLDPACGSGAFLVHALERLSALTRLAGDTRSETDRRRAIVSSSIFGVDVHPTAVWLCELRLWLAIVLDSEVRDPLAVPPLPNLDHNIRVGDALRSPGFHVVASAANPESLVYLHARYARATGARKRTLARSLDRAERQRAEEVVRSALATVSARRRELLAAARGPDLFGKRRGSIGDEGETLAALRAQSRAWRRRIRDVRTGRTIPFSFPSHFPLAASRGGFDIVVGNPPWVRLHRIPADVRPELRQVYRVFREAAWERGAEDARAGRGFAAQVDLAALFAERSVDLAREGGTIALLLPVKLWHSLAGGGLRRLCLEWNSLRAVEDWSEAPATFDAAVYPSLVVVRRGRDDNPEPLSLGLHRREMAINWRTGRSALPLDASSGAPWLILPPDARAAFDHVARAGIALGASGIGHPTLGLKSGCNEAFLVHVLERDRDDVLVSDGNRRGRLESALVRPVLRGEGTTSWRAARTDEHIVFPLRPSGVPLLDLPPGVRAWLGPWRRTLLKRADARHGTPWWSLFRVDGAFADRPRVVWADMARAPGAVVLEAGSPVVPLNSCYVLRCRDLTDAYAFAAWLNSPLAAAWLGSIAEPARGGYRRFLAWTVARLPIPKDWNRAREILAPLGARASRGERVTPFELVEQVCRAFRIRQSRIAELLAWTQR